MKDLKELKAIRNEVPQAEVKDPFVAAFIEEFDLDQLEAEINAEQDEREYLYDEALNRVNQLKKERAARLKELETHPDIELLKSRSKALHDRLYSTKKGEYGKIPQVPPTGALSRKYNEFNEKIKQCHESLIENDGKLIEIDNELAHAQAQLDMAKALAETENREWEAGRKDQD